MKQPIISIKNVDKSYGSSKILENVNWDIEEGKIYGLIGKNGSGKTTLFKVLLGLSNFQAGKISILDNEKDLSYGRKQIGFFIGANFFKNFNATQNIDYYRQLKGIKDKSETERVLEIVGLKNVNTKFKGYSLGMKQRLGIANALLGNPKILILDEPTNGLDPEGIVDIRKLIKKLNEEYNMTIIVSSHILGELQNTADEFAIINNKTLQCILSSDDLKHSSNSVVIKIDDLDKAKNALESAGVKILDINQETSLEDYYFSVVGGKENV